MEAQANVERCIVIMGSFEILKKSNSLEVAEFPKSRSIEEDPTFLWWISCALKKRDVITSSADNRSRKTYHKYGVEVPSSVKHAYEIDSRNEKDF